MHSGGTLPKDQNMSHTCVFSYFLASKFTVCSTLEAGHLSPWLLINISWLQGAKGSTWQREWSQKKKEHSFLQECKSGLWSAWSWVSFWELRKERPHWIEECTSLSCITSPDLLLHARGRDHGRDSELYSVRNPGTGALQGCFWCLRCKLLLSGAF